MEKQGHIVLAVDNKGQFLDAKDVAQLVEHLPPGHKALGSSPSTTEQLIN